MRLVNGLLSESTSFRFRRHSGNIWSTLSRKKLSEAFDVKLVFLDLSDPHSRKCVSAGIQIFTLDLVEKISTWNFRFVKKMCRIIFIVIGTHDKPWSLRGEFIIMTIGWIELSLPEVKLPSVAVSHLT